MICTENSIARWTLRFAVLLAAVGLSACDGGGGKDGDESSSAGDEGTPSAPVTLTVGTARTGSIGAFGTSYYRFTPASGSYHRISLTNTRSDLSWALFGNSSFSTLILDCDNQWSAANESCIPETALAAGTTYYLSVDEFDDVAGTYTLLVEPVAMISASPFGVAEADGTWTLCKFDGAMGHDMDDVMSISGTALTRTTYHAASANGSCSGTRALASTLTYTLTDMGFGNINNWTNGTVTTAPPSSAGGFTFSAMPSATRVLATPLAGTEEKWVWFIDNSNSQQPRLYHDSATPSTPCAASSAGYAQCLISTEYYTKQ